MAAIPRMLDPPPVGALRRVRVADGHLNVWEVGDAGRAVLLVHGIPTERLAVDLGTAEVTWVEDASHFVPGDRPDAVADAVLRLLEWPTPGPPRSPA